VAGPVDRRPRPRGDPEGDPPGAEGNGAADGQISIARLNGELLLRKLQTDGIQVRLLPGGSKLAPLEIDTRFCRFEVVGVVTHVIRKV